MKRVFRELARGAGLWRTVRHAGGSRPGPRGTWQLRLADALGDVPGHLRAALLMSTAGVRGGSGCRREPTQAESGRDGGVVAGAPDPESLG